MTSFHCATGFVYCFPAVRASTRTRYSRDLRRPVSTGVLGFTRSHIRSNGSDNDVFRVTFLNASRFSPTPCRDAFRTAHRSEYLFDRLSFIIAKQNRSVFFLFVENCICSGIVDKTGFKTNALAIVNIRILKHRYVRPSAQLAGRVSRRRLSPRG